MRKQTKIAAVVSAAALLALGASMTSFAASKGTWMMVDGEWYCYDKNGDAYENTFCSSNGKEYYVGEDGQLVRSAWVEYDGNYYFVNSSGAKITNDWRLTTPYDDDSADEEWYYFKSSGKAQIGKGTNIKGQTYLFDNEGRMQTGWVALTASTSSNAKEYLEIGGEDSTAKLSDYTDVYFCGDEDDGHAKKNKWYKTWRPEDFDDEDEDNDEFWYWIDKNGKVYIPTEAASGSNATGYKYKLEDAALAQKKVSGSYESFEITKKKVNSKDYFFNNDGEMLSQFIEVVTPNTADGLVTGMYYFGGDDDGSMKTGSQSVRDDNGDTYKFYFGTKNSTSENKGVGITGNKSNKLYYKGLLLTADDYKYQIATVDDVHYFIVNKNGSIQHSCVEYKEDSDVLIDASDLAKTAFSTTEGLYKYSIDAATASAINKVDMIDETEVMH